jgi:hypothetical protein
MVKLPGMWALAGAKQAASQPVAPRRAALLARQMEMAFQLWVRLSVMKLPGWTRRLRNEGTPKNHGA